jgi:protein-tyrosine-phosphatase
VTSTGSPGAAEAFSLLIVCTANQCRSPMGEALARREMQRYLVDAVVGSAGTNATDGRPPTEGMERTARKMGLDLSRHRSRSVDAEMVAASTLIVAMERRHIIELAGNHGAPLGRTYTLPELASLALEASPRTVFETIDDWLARIAPGRTHASVLSSRTEEVPDPTGQSARRYRKVAAQLEALTATVLDAAFGHRG